MPTDRENAPPVSKPSLIRASRFHLESVGESYVQHFRAATVIALRLVRASGACALHALIPGVCTRSASDEVARLNAELMRRNGNCVRDPASDRLRSRPSHVEISSS